MPVLGTGQAKINVSREAMIRAIISSFIPACSEKKFCEKLTIVIRPKDYLEPSIDLQKLGDYLQHLCEYADISRTETGAGRSNLLALSNHRHDIQNLLTIFFFTVHLCSPFGLKSTFPSSSSDIGQSCISRGTAPKSSQALRGEHPINLPPF